MSGLGALAAGICIGVVGDYGVRSYAREPKLFVGMLLILIFGEALALYGLIVGLIVGVKSPSGLPCVSSLFFALYLSHLLLGGCDFTRQWADV
jgi:V-type H+-transporting ATPase proteolipid subunit